MVKWTEAALVDLDGILAYTAEKSPSAVVPLESRIRAAVERLGRWPESVRLV